MVASLANTNCVSNVEVCGGDRGKCFCDAAVDCEVVYPTTECSAPTCSLAGVCGQAVASPGEPCTGGTCDSSGTCVANGTGGGGGSGAAIVVGPRPFTGGEHTCLLQTDGNVDCFGKTLLKSATPIPKSGDVALGKSHSCVVTSTGRVECWGNNNFGQVGDFPDIVDQPTEVALPTRLSYVKVASGAFHSCAISDVGSLHCWGRNEAGQLGTGNTALAAFPDVVSGLPAAVVAFDLGERHSCAVVSGGDLYCWGANDFGQIGGPLPGSDVPIKVAVPAVEGVTVGGSHTCAWSSTGALCWGKNDDGQLGNGQVTSSSTPVIVKLDDIQAVTAGRNHTCAQTSEHSLYCWGANSYGQLGDGTTTGKTVPTKLALLVQWVNADNHTCVTDTSGVAWCWGRNHLGQLGNGNTVDRSVPVTIGAK